MGRILWSRKARADMLDIWLWVAEHGDPRTADTVVDRIETRTNALALHPEIGPTRKDIAEFARMLVCERWLILYEIDDQGMVRIVRVVDGAADLSRLDW